MFNIGISKTKNKKWNIRSNTKQIVSIWIEFEWSISIEQLNDASLDSF